MMNSVISRLSKESLDLIKMSVFAKLFDDTSTVLDLIQFFNQIKIVVPYNLAEWSRDYNQKKTIKIAEFSTDLRTFVKWSYDAPYDFEYSSCDGFEIEREVFDHEETAIAYSFTRVDESYSFEDLCVGALVNLSDIYENKISDDIKVWDKYLLLSDNKFFEEYNQSHFKKVSDVSANDAIYVLFKNGTWCLKDHITYVDHYEDKGYVDIKFGSFEKFEIGKSEDYIAKPKVINKEYSDNIWHEDKRNIIENIRVLENKTILG